MSRAYIGLGSNLDSPTEQLHRALASVNDIDRTRTVSTSSLYRSRPMGPQEQPDFINAVSELETELGVRELFSELQRIETDQGRVRTALRWGPRSIDIDLLLYDDLIMDEPDLKIPHPGMPVRSFVLVPLAELDADRVIPGFGSLARLIAGIDTDGLERIVQA